MELDLNQLRKEINEVDAEIVELFKKRMDIAASVAEYKKQNGLPVLDAARERALLARISDMSGEKFEGYARTLYHTMLDVSRAYQYTKLNSHSEVYESIKASLEKTSDVFPARARVACQGVEGAYSQHACDKMFTYPRSRPRGFLSFPRSATTPHLTLSFLLLSRANAVTVFCLLKTARRARSRRFTSLCFITISTLFGRSE